MGVEFKKLSTEESTRLRDALRRNAEQGAPLQMDALTTGWKSDDGLEPTDQECIDAIRSVPCHYADNYDAVISNPNGVALQTEPDDDIDPVKYALSQLRLVREMTAKATIVQGCVQRAIDALEQL